MKSTASIIGYSGHAYVVLDCMLSKQYKPVGYCDLLELSSNPFNLNYYGNEQDYDVILKLKKQVVFFGIGDNYTRERVFNYLMQNNITCPQLIHASATISATAKIGTATVIMPNATVNALAKIGRAVICNTSAIIEHECDIDDFVHIAPGAVLAGNVSIGKGTFVGANAVIKQNIKIGKNVVIGAGAVIVDNIEDGTVVFGNPGRSK